MVYGLVFPCFLFVVLIASILFDAISTTKQYRQVRQDIIDAHAIIHGHTKERA